MIAFKRAGVFIVLAAMHFMQPAAAQQADTAAAVEPNSALTAELFYQLLLGAVSYTHLTLPTSDLV